MRIAEFFPRIILTLAALIVWENGYALSPKGEIVIGTTVSLTGRYLRPSSEQLNGLKLWVDQKNADGGLLNRKIKLHYYDDESNPDKASELIERLIDHDNVDILVSPYSSPLALKASTIVEKKSIPMIVAGASATKIWKRDYQNIFGLYTPAAKYMDGVIDFASSQGLQRVALIYENTVFPNDVAAGAKARLKKNKLELVLEKSYPKGTKNFSSVVEELNQAVPDILLVGSYLEDSIAITKEVKRQKFNAPILAFAVGPGLPDFGARLREDAQGIMGNSQWESSLPFPGIKDFKDQYLKRYGYRPGYHAAGGFGAGQLIGQALLRTRTVNANDIRKSLRKLSSQTVFGPFKVDASGMQIGKPVYTIQWFGKRRIIVLPKEYAERTPLLLAPKRDNKNK